MFLGIKSQDINADILSFSSTVKNVCYSNFYILFFYLPAIVIVSIALAGSYSHILCTTKQGHKKYYRLCHFCVIV